MEQRLKVLAGRADYGCCVNSGWPEEEIMDDLFVKDCFWQIILHLEKPNVANIYIWECFYWRRRA